MFEELKDLKDTYEAARQQMDKFKEAPDEMQLLLNFLKALVA